jgi:hypothetical protein
VAAFVQKASSTVHWVDDVKHGYGVDESTEHAVHQAPSVQNQLSFHGFRYLCEVHADIHQGACAV